MEPWSHGPYWVSCPLGFLYDNLDAWKNWRFSFNSVSQHRLKVVKRPSARNVVIDYTVNVNIGIQESLILKVEIESFKTAMQLLSFYQDWADINSKSGFRFCDSRLLESKLRPRIRNHDSMEMRVGSALFFASSPQSESFLPLSGIWLCLSAASSSKDIAARCEHQLTALRSALARADTWVGK